jgi:hypothetical protein
MAVAASPICRRKIAKSHLHLMRVFIYPRASISVLINVCKLHIVFIYSLYNFGRLLLLLFGIEYCLWHFTIVYYSVEKYGADEFCLFITEYVKL